MKRLLAGLLLFFCCMQAKSQHIEKYKITDIEKMMHSGKDEVLVLNFWATFCKPCVAEIPGFIQTVEKYKAQQVSLLLVSLDLPSYYPARIEAFVKKNHFASALGWLAESNADYFCPKIDNSWSGSIPATLIINTKTGYKKFFEGEISTADFEKALVDVLQKK